jgi:hypothetical protein
MLTERHRRSFPSLPLPPRRSPRTLHHNAIESRARLLAVCAVQRVARERLARLCDWRRRGPPREQRRRGHRCGAPPPVRCARPAAHGFTALHVMRVKRMRRLRGLPMACPTSVGAQYACRR